MDDSMWDFLKNGKQKSNIPVLKNLVNTLIKMTTQKTAGQRDDKPNDVPFESLEMLKWAIICEAVALVLSGDLDKVEVGIMTEPVSRCCKNCKTRRVNCHATCEKYLAYRKMRNKINAARQKEKIKDTLEMQRLQKAKDVMLAKKQRGMR